MKRTISVAAIIVASVAAGMILTADFGWLPWSKAQQLTPEGTIPTVALPSFADLAERVLPAVVSITSTEVIQPGEQPRGIDPFDFFFGPGIPRQFPDEERVIPSGGSGFIISPDGYIITNNHVIEGATKVEVHYAGGERTAEATVVGRDPATDLAVIKIDVDGPLPTARLGDSDAVRVGDWAVAIGNPLQFENTLTVGVVSAKGRSLGLSEVTYSFENFIQTDAAINRGNSGGPLLNLRGEVIGINTAISGGGQNIGFAVPVNIAKRIYPQLKEEGRVIRGFLGINITEVDQQIQEAFDLPTNDGVLVQSVTPGSPSDEAGVQHGDVIVHVDEVRIERSRDLIDYVSDIGPGVDVRLQVIRGGRRMNIAVETGERPSEFTEVAREDEVSGDATRSKIGISIQDLTPQTRRMFGFDADVTGVLVTDVRQLSPAGDAGLIEGDIIREVNGQQIASAADVQRIVERAGSGEYLRFYVTRVGREQTISSYVVVRVR
ncbi:MAG: trypsin-like peptidase domain-containing protein [Thermoanaerobaculia bacterium]